MSVFEEQVTPENNNEQVEQEVQTTNVLDELVGEGKKFKSVEDLAKGKIEADKFIPELQRQIEELKQDLAAKEKNDYAKELLDLLQKQGTTTSNVDSEVHNNNNASTQDEDNTPSLNGENDIQTLVEQALAKKEADAKVQSNLQLVESTLQERFGTEAANTVKNKATELGMSLKKMQEIATESPNAFFALLGEAKPTPTTITKGSVNTEALPTKSSNARDNQYYQKLRRENKSLYYSAAIQRQMMEDAQKLGSKFYN